MLEGGSNARYLPTGHLIYALGDSLFGVAFDADSVSVTGGAVPLAQGVLRAIATAGANYGVSEDGTLVYVRGGAGGLGTLVWVDRQEREEPIEGAPTRAYVAARLSPDGTRVALEVSDEDVEIWILDLARQALTRLTFDPSPSTSPVWTPDGRRVVFTSPRNGVPNLFWQAADGTGAVEQLTDNQNAQTPTSFGPDGTHLVFYEQSQGMGRNLHMLSMDDEHRSEVLVTANSNQDASDVSPDGRWIAYESLESGQDEIFVRPFPEVESGRWQVSADGGQEPVWSADGSELFYRTLDERIMAVRGQAGPTFAAAAPQLVLDASGYRARAASGGRAFDVSADGERFLMIKPGSDVTDASTQSQIVIVENWFEELKRLVPVN